MMVELHEARSGKRVAFKPEDVLRVYEYEHKTLSECNSYVVVSQPDKRTEYIDGKFLQTYQGATYLYVTEPYDRVMELLCQ